MKKSLLVLLAALCLLFAVPVVAQLGQAQPAVDGPSFDPAATVERDSPVANGLASENAYITADVLISRAEDRQSYPDMAYNDDDNEWLVVWQDNRSGTWDIHGQRVDADGVIQGGVLDIGSGEDDYQYPAVAYDTTQQRYLVVWQNSTNHGIYTRIVNADGSLNSAIRAAASGSKACTHPDVAYNPGTDEYLVVWAYEEGAGNHDIWARKVGVDGIVDPGGAYAISTLASDELAPALLAYPVTSVNPARYMLAWSNNATGTYNIVGRRLLSDGSPAGVRFGISTSTDGGTGDEHRPVVAFDSTQDLAFVVWEYAPATGEQEIVGRLIDISQTGASVRGDWLVIEDAPGDQQYPDVTYNGPEKEYLVIWDDNNDLFGSRVKADASAASDAIVICNEAGGQRNGAVAFGGDRSLVAWSDYRAPRVDIMGQRLSLDAALLGPEIGLSAAANDQSRPALAYGTEQQEWLVVWGDERGDHPPEIWGQFVNRDGLLVGEPLRISGYHGSFSPDIAYNPDDDEFLVVWDLDLGSGLDIFGIQVSAASHNLAGTVRQITTDPDDQAVPSVAYNELDGLYLVVWEDLRDVSAEQTDNTNIYGRRLNRDASFADAVEFVVCARDDAQYRAQTAFNPVVDQWLVTWIDESDPGSGVSAQRVGVDDPPLVGTVIDIHRTSDGVGGRHALACNTQRGVWFSAWRDLRNSSTTDFDIYGRRINSQGKLLGSQDIAISNAPADQKDPYAAYHPALNRYFVVWEDYRYGDGGFTGPDIMGQALEANGSLLFTESDANETVWVFSGSQVEPTIASDPSDGRGLVVWEDWRNGLTADVYGRLGDPEASLVAMRVFLPVVLKDY